MPRSLGLFVTSDKHLDQLIALCEAAGRKQVEVMIFFTHRGLLLTQEPRFHELEGLAKMSLCRVGFEKLGLKAPVPGLEERDFATQSRHVELIGRCDRYLVF